MPNFLLYFIAGALFIVFGVFSIKSENAKAKRCVAPAMGRIVRVDVEYEEKEDSIRKQKNYIPVFQYIVNGKTVESSSNIISRDKKKYKVGDTAEILFNPSKPSEFVIKGKSKKSGVGFGIAMMAIGVLLIVLGITQI